MYLTLMIARLYMFQYPTQYMVYQSLAVCMTVFDCFCPELGWVQSQFDT